MLKPYYSLHNHASNAILSPEDIATLIKKDNMRGIGAVGHDGALYTCEKVYGYSRKKARIWIEALKQKYPDYKGGTDASEEDIIAQRVAFAEELRQNGKRYGLWFG